MPNSVFKFRANLTILNTGLSNTNTNSTRTSTSDDDSKTGNGASGGAGGSAAGNGSSVGNAGAQDYTVAGASSTVSWNRRGGRHPSTSTSIHASNSTSRHKHSSELVETAATSAAAHAAKAAKAAKAANAAARGGLNPKLLYASMPPRARRAIVRRTSSLSDIIDERWNVTFLTHLVFCFTFER